MEICYQGCKVLMQGKLIAVAYSRVHIETDESVFV